MDVFSNLQLDLLRVTCGGDSSQLQTTHDGGKEKLVADVEAVWPGFPLQTGSSRGIIPNWPSLNKPGLEVRNGFRRRSGQTFLIMD